MVIFANIQKNMSSRLVTIIILFSSVTFSQWYPQTAGTNYELRSVFFTDQNTGYICGYNRVLKTTNAGENWISTFLQGKHNSVTFTSSLTGYICSDSGKIFKTTNSGGNWSLESTGTIKNLTTISFLNANTGIAAGYGKTILKTTSGGSSWFDIANLVWEVDFLSSKIISADNYYITGTDSYIIRTTNGGANWISYTHGAVNPLFTIEFIDENTGFATGCCGMYMTTTNAGTNWTYDYYLSQGFTFTSLKFVNGVTGFCSGGNGMIYKTTNLGISWDSTVTGTNEILYSLFMTDANTGWAVGNFGTILKTTNGGGTGFPIGIAPISTEIPGTFMLYQNYPNPFNPVTKIKFSIPTNVKRQTSNVIFKVYNIAGELITTLINQELQPGTYEVEFDGNIMASGVYYYVLQTDNYRQTKKMVLLK